MPFYQIQNESCYFNVLHVRDITVANIRLSVNKHLLSWTIIFNGHINHECSSNSGIVSYRLGEISFKCSWFKSLTHFLLQVVGLKHPLVDERLFSWIIWDQTGSLRLERTLETTNIYETLIFVFGSVHLLQKIYYYYYYSSLKFNLKSRFDIFLGVKQ